MKQAVNEVALEQLVALARDAGTSAHDELPAKIKGALAGRRASDRADQPQKPQQETGWRRLLGHIKI
ncbi:MAG: hypothetical protein ACJAYG_001651 [Oceanicoccus sp.]|jgi:hypothetical protein